MEALSERIASALSRSLETPRNWLLKNPVQAASIFSILLLAGVSHGLNMFAFPYFENDEATYASRAWSVVSEGELDPYTYRYDHAPVGWLMIAFWQLATGGMLFFDSFLHSSRAMMLVTFMALSVLVYLTALRVTSSRLASFTATAIFVLSPLGIYFQRRLLLDNIVSLLLISALFAAMDPKRRLISFQSSAVFFGLAVLTKLTAVFAFPALLFLVLKRANREGRSHVVVQWLGIIGIIIGLFIVFAALKGELLPAKINPDGTTSNVSLIDTTVEQLNRGGKSHWPWDSNSMFYINMKDWLGRDAFFMILGFLSLIASFFGIKKHPLQAAVVLYCLGFLFFLMRGKLVLNHYIIPLLPGIALLMAIFFAKIETWFKRLYASHHLKSGFVAGIFAGILLISLQIGNYKAFKVDENQNLQAAQTWIINNIPTDAVIVTDNYAYPDLHYRYKYTKIFYMFPAEYDPEVKKLYGNEWRNIEYILVTHEIFKQVKDGTLPTVGEAFKNSRPVAVFKKDSSSYIDEKNLISTNGDWAAIYKVEPEAN